MSYRLLESGSRRLLEDGASARILESPPAVVVVSSASGYHLYSNSGDGGPIDYGTPIAEVDGLADVSWQGFALPPGVWLFGVRAYNPNGEDQNVDAVVAITIGADGADISDVPFPPVALLAVPSASASIRVEWQYPLTAKPRKPTGFHVYIGTGGVVDYSSAVLTAPAATAGLVGIYSATLSGLTDGTTYTIGVRAFNATGEESNTSSVGATAKSTGPNAVQGLTLTAII